MNEPELYSIMPPWGFDGDFVAADSIARTKDTAWEKFCHPALKREAYEGDGFKAVKVKIVEAKDE